MTNAEDLGPVPPADVVSSSDVAYATGTTGFLAQPAKPGNYPGVVMVHEWWGLNGYIKDMAKQLAAQGYRVLAVDLHGGKVATTPDEARALVGGFDGPTRVANLQAATAYLRTQGSPKVAALGWCFGGGQAAQLAASGAPLAATVVYYGQPVTSTAALKQIRGPVLGIFGDRDTSIPVDRVQAFDAALSEAGIPHEIKVYEGVGHAFANPSGANHAPAETKDAWARTLVFLKRHLQ
jgi:carboxymethylenebutenolidase